MIYTSYEDLASTIRRNIWKVPADVELIVGVPRSGMICALMVAEFINKPVADLESFIDGRVWRTGRRGRAKDEYRKVLIIDDTVYAGNAIKNAKEMHQMAEDAKRG